MSEGKNTVYKESQQEAVHLKEVRTEVCKVLVHVAQAYREFFFLLHHKRKTDGCSSWKAIS